MEEYSDAFLESLYQAQHGKMLVMAQRLTGSAEDALDLVQDTFLLAAAHQDELAAHPKPEGWLMLTLKNLAISQRRRAMNHPEVSLETLAGLAERPAEAPLDTLLPGQLSAEDRQVLIWRFEQGLEYREMADRLGISQSACRSRVSRAAARCRKFMDRD